MLWALGNALVKTFTITVQKFIGLASQTFGHVAFVAFIVSLLQVSVGFIAIKYQKLPLLPNKKWNLGLLSYKYGAYIALENLIVYGVLLSLLAISGWIFFGEGNMPVKFIGIFVYLTAFSLTNNKTWNFFTSLGRKRQQSR